MESSAQISSHVQVTTVTDSREAAQQISAAVVRDKLAACGQVSGPVTSTYWWQGALESAEEWRVVFKTTAALAQATVAAVAAAHTYEVPEILVTPIVGGHAAYLAWIDSETQQDVTPEQ